MPVKAEVWALSRTYWERTQKFDGSWTYTPDTRMSSASMTCAGISSLIITGLRRFQGHGVPRGRVDPNCGQGAVNPNLQRGIDWMSSHFQRGPELTAWASSGSSTISTAWSVRDGWAGIRFFGQHDWYRLGAEELVHEQDRLSGFWQGR